MSLTDSSLSLSYEIRSNGLDLFEKNLGYVLV